MQLKNKLANETAPQIKIGLEVEPTILKVESQEEVITATLSDGRVISIPKAWYKPLRETTSEQLSKYEILPQGQAVYFSEIDEYLPVRIFTHGLNSACC